MHPMGAIDALPHVDGGSKSALLSGRAVPLVEEQGASADVTSLPEVPAAAPLTSQLPSEMPSLSPAPSIHPDESPSTPHSILATIMSASVDNVSSIAERSHEGTLPAFSDSVLADPVAETAHLSELVAPVEAEVRTEQESEARMSPVVHMLPGEQPASPSSSSHNSWVTAPEGVKTGSSCGALADCDPLTPRTVSSAPQSHSSLSPVPAAIAMPAAGAYQHVDTGASTSLVAAGLPRRVDADTLVAYSATSNDLSRMSGAHSQAILLQQPPSSESASPSRPSSPFTDSHLPASAGQAPRSADRLERFQGSASVRQLSGARGGLSGAQGEGSNVAPVSSRSNPLYSPQQHRTSHLQPPCPPTNSTVSSPLATRSSGGILRRTSSSFKGLKRALVRKLHSAKLFAMSHTISNPQSRTAGATLESSPTDGAAQPPLYRRSHAPASSLFRLIQESILNITDDEGDHSGSRSAAPDTRRASRADVTDVLVMTSARPLRTGDVSPAGVHVVHRSAHLDHGAVTAGLHTPHSRTTSAQSGPQLLPPSPAALVGSQLSESVSSQGLSDASPEPLSPARKAHIVTPRPASVPRHGEQTSLRLRQGYEEQGHGAPLLVRQGQRGKDELHQQVHARRSGSALRRQSALATCFCGMLEQHSVELSTGNRSD